MSTRPVPVLALALALASSLAVAAPAPFGDDTAALGDVVLGEAFLDDWMVTDRAAFAGGVRLVLERGDERIDVDVVRRGASPRAPVFSDALELYVMDGHDGDHLTDPDLVDALQVLLEQIGDDAHQAHLAQRLMTHEQRLDRFPKLMRRAHKR